MKQLNNVSRARLERLTRLNNLINKVAAKSEVSPSDHRKIVELRAFIQPATTDPAVGELAKSYAECVDILLKTINLFQDNKSDEAVVLAGKFAESCETLSAEIRKFEGR
jgi:ABC-type methionine transport system ATPase subunit